MDVDFVGVGTETDSITEGTQDPQNETDEATSITPWFLDQNLFGNPIKEIVDPEQGGSSFSNLTRAAWGPNSSFSSIGVSGPSEGLGAGNIEIGAAFSWWKWPAGTNQNVINHGILRAAQNSIYATNARIDNVYDHLNDKASTVTVNNAFTRIAKIENWQGSVNNSVNSLSSRINAVDDARVSNYNNLSGRINDNYNSLSSRISDNYKKLWDRTVTLFNNDQILQNNIENLNTKVNSNYTTLWNRDVDLQKNINTVAADVRSLSAEITGLSSILNVIKNLVTIIRDTVLGMSSDLTVVKNLVTIARDKLINIESALNKLTLVNADGKLLIFDKLDKQFSELLNLSSLLGQTKNLVTIIRDKSIIFETALKTVNSNLGKIDGGIATLIASNVADTLILSGHLGDITALSQKSLEYLKSTSESISGVKSDLTIVKNLITIVRDKTILFDTYFKQSNKNLENILATLKGLAESIENIPKSWYSNDYWTPTLLEDDGGMVKLIKSQTQRLYELIFGFLSAFREDGIFWLAWESSLPKLGELITKCLDTSTPGTPLYAMRYSMTAGFMELQEAVEYATGKIRDNQIVAMTNQETLISILEEIRDNTAIITQWLKLIYEKPNVPSTPLPFDYDRLAEMLESIKMDVNIGDTVNEAGTNIWDVLGGLFDNLGSIFETGLKELGKTLRSILDFLDGLLDKIIHLIVPEDTSFLDTSFATIKGKFQVKFGSILDLGGKVKDVFVPAKVDFFESTTFEIMGAKFTADKATADLFIPKFRVVMALFIWFEVAWFVYRKITGGGDMINDN